MQLPDRKEAKSWEVLPVVDRDGASGWGGGDGDRDGPRPEVLLGRRGDALGVGRRDGDP